MAIETEGPFKGWSFERLHKWLAEQPSEFQDELHKVVLSRPDIMVEAVKALRAMARDPKVPRNTCEEAQRILETKGFDDQSLQKEDDDEATRQ